MAKITGTVKKVYAECKCHQKDHLLIFELDMDQDEGSTGVPHDPEIFVYPILNPERSFWRRVLIGIKYIFKPHAHKYDYYDDVWLSQESILKIMRIAELYGWVKAVRKAKRVRVERDKLEGCHG